MQGGLGGELLLPAGPGGSGPILLQAGGGGTQYYHLQQGGGATTMLLQGENGELLNVLVAEDKVR